MSNYKEYIIPNFPGKFTIYPDSYYSVCRNFVYFDSITGKSILENKDDFVNIQDGKIQPVLFRSMTVEQSTYKDYKVRLVLNDCGQLLAEIYKGGILTRSGFTGITLFSEFDYVELHKELLYFYSSYASEREDFFLSLYDLSDSKYYDIFYGEDLLSPKKYDINSKVDLTCFDYSSDNYMSTLKRRAVLGETVLYKTVSQAKRLAYSYSTIENDSIKIVDSNFQVSSKDVSSIVEFEAENKGKNLFSRQDFWYKNVGIKVLGKNTIVAGFVIKESSGVLVDEFLFLLYHNGCVYVTNNAFVWQKDVYEDNKVYILSLDMDDVYESQVSSFEIRNSAMSDYYYSNVSIENFMSILPALPVVLFNCTFYTSGVGGFDINGLLRDYDLKLNGVRHVGAVSRLRDIQFPLLKGQVRHNNVAYFTNGCLRREVYGEHFEEVVECLDSCFNKSWGY